MTSGSSSSSTTSSRAISAAARTGTRTTRRAGRILRFISRNNGGGASRQRFFAHLQYACGPIFLLDSLCLKRTVVPSMSLISQVAGIFCLVWQKCYIRLYRVCYLALSNSLVPYTSMRAVVFCSLAVCFVTDIGRYHYKKKVFPSVVHLQSAQFFFHDQIFPMTCASSIRGKTLKIIFGKDVFSFSSTGVNPSDCLFFLRIITAI